MTAIAFTVFFASFSMLRTGVSGIRPSRRRFDGFFAAFRPLPLDRSAGVNIIALVPVSQRIAMPRRLGRNRRQPQLVPDRSRAFHEFAPRQRERRHIVLERGVDENGRVFAGVRFRPMSGGTVGQDLNVLAGV